MAEHRQRRCLQGSPRNTGPAVTAGPVPLTTPQFCMHRPGLKCLQSNACPCWASNCPCTSGCPSGNCRNRGRIWAPTAPTITTNVIKNVKDAQKDAPTLLHAIPPVVFHQDAPVFCPNVLLRVEEWPALPARADTAHAAPSFTKTTAPDPAAPAAVGSRKRN